MLSAGAEKGRLIRENQMCHTEPKASAGLHLLLEKKNTPRWEQGYQGPSINVAETGY